MTAESLIKIGIFRRSQTAATGEALLAVVADRQRGTNVHRALRGRGLVVILRLFVKIDVSLVVVVFQKIGSFLEAYAAGRAGVVHIPATRNVFG